MASALNYVHRSTCRICESADLVEILDLGQSPLANAYVRSEALGSKEPMFPLKLHYCRNCSLAQLLDVVDSAILFKDYHFLTSASVPSVEHFKRYSQEAVKPFVTSKDDLVVDIGGNDGVLLNYVKQFARVLNIDPADNLAPLSEAKGVPFYPAFFTSSVAEDILARYGKAKVITANNVFAHTDPLRDVLKGIATLMADDGVFIFEVHWQKHFIEEGAFDQIYHEHLCFHSLHALSHLVALAGMKVFDVQIVPMQGRSLRVFAAKNRTVHQSVARILQEEKDAKLTNEATLTSFAENVRRNRELLQTLLTTLKRAGKKIVGYGAPAKGNTFLNYYGIGPDVLDYLTDTTPLKQGMYSPGMHIPIVSPERLAIDKPDYALLLAWNFRDHILEKEKGLREQGMKFIISIPRIEIV